MTLIAENLFESHTFDKRFEELFETHSKNSLDFTVYIPSKGRANKVKTISLLETLGTAKIYLVIEPNDYDEYSKVFSPDQLLCLDACNQGIYYARNWIKNYSLSKGEEYHWQIDDDMTRLHRIFWIDGKTKKYKITSSNYLSMMEELIRLYPNIGAFSIRNGAFMHSYKTKYSINRQMCGFVLYKNLPEIKFNPDIIEDTDYSIQLLTNGYVTVIFNSIGFVTPPQMKNKGGNTEFFQNNGLYKRHVALTKKYPGFFKQKVVDGVSRILPSTVWSKFKQEPIERDLYDG